jgi:hypothetical protein
MTQLPAGCTATAFSSLPFFGLDGSILGVDVAARSVEACRVSCCNRPACAGFTASDSALRPCLLYANVTQVVPNPLVDSAVLLSALPSATPGGGGSGVVAA